MTDRYTVIHPDTLEAMRRAGHVAKLEARIEKLETALLNIIATFGYGSSGGAYKNRYFNCLEIAKAELKHLGLKGQYSNYVKYVDDRKALEDK